jgi:hypothetical protein
MAATQAVKTATVATATAAAVGWAAAGGRPWRRGLRYSDKGNKSVMRH